MSCASQAEACKSFCDAHGLTPGPTYTDAGLSSTRDHQVALTKLLNDAKAKRFDAVIVNDAARFGRDQLEVATNLYQLEQRCGIPVHFVKLPATGEPIDT
ncbi:recombinase family protein, partial [Nitrospinae bacterium AH_259_B05_G02_I21]|nr:recombinase family protein [Nitrospinae bacterium AH_259_B05_G02_I21]